MQSRVRMKWALCAIAGVLAFGASAMAIELGGVSIRGYGSVGYMVTDDNNYMTAETEDGSFENYDFGINAIYSLTPELRIGAQAKFAKLGEMGYDYPTIDWANVDWRPLDEAGLRLGILKLPVGLYNEGRDLDMLRTPAFLPQTVYNEQLRDFFAGQPGGQVYGNVRAGPVGSFNYSFAVFKTLVDEDESVWANGFIDGILLRTGLAMAQNPNAFPKDSWDFDNQISYSGSLQWETPLYGLRFGGTYWYQDTDIEIQTKNPMLPKLDVAQKLDYYTIYSAEYVYNQWRFAAEYMMYKFSNDIGGNVDVRKGDGIYGQVNYRVNEKLELSAGYGIAYGNTDDKDGDDWVQLGQILQNPEQYPDYLAWQKDFTLAARFDINMNWLVKLEWHYIDGVNQLYVSDNPGGFDRYWNFFAIKTTYTF
jgi:hypothetical protein